MLFQRKHKQPVGRKIRSWLWPERGLKRAMTYWWHRIARLPDTSHGIAAGVAAGVALSFTPFLGLHIVLGWLLALIIRGNYIGVVIGTVVGNPWTFPFIFALNFKIGAYFIGTDVPENLSDLPIIILEIISKLFYQIWGTVMGVKVDAQVAVGYTQDTDVIAQSYETLLLPLLIGSVPTTIISWIISYVALKTLIERYRQRQHDKRLSKIATLNSAAQEETTTND